MDATELLRALAGLTPDQKAAASAILGGAPPPSSETPKFSRVLDAVADGDVDEVIEAAARGLAFCDANPGREHEALQYLQVVAPVVASAAQTNSAYRRKPIRHSLQQVVDYLLCDQAEQRRKASRKAKRRAALTTFTAAPPAPPASEPPASE